MVDGLTAYPATAASARIRVVGHIPFLAEFGVDLRHRPALSPGDYRLLQSTANPTRKVGVLGRSAIGALAFRKPDGLLLIHKLMLLAPLPGVDPPRRLDVYDFDDALTVGSASPANRAFQWVKQERRRSVAYMRRARLVLAANSFLASQARRYASNVEVLPSCVDPSAQPLREHADRETLTIGWIGSHTTVAYLKPLLPVIARMNERGHPARLVVVGGDTGVRAEWLQHRSWSLETQAADLASFDVGVMPLPDDAWTRGKSGYKLLQYFSAGVPAVASPVGVNADLVAGGRGATATTAHEWEQALIEVLGNATTRRERGAAARKFVEAHYSYQRWTPELAVLLRALVE